MGLRLDPGGDPQQRRLAGAGRTKQAEDFPGLRRQGDAFDRLLAMIAVVDAIEGQTCGKSHPCGASGLLRRRVSRIRMHARRSFRPIADRDPRPGISRRKT